MPEPTLRELFRELLYEGGVCVTTPAGSAGTEPLHARTLIQIDGDVVVKITRAVLGDEQLWREHCAAVQARLAPVQRLRSRLRVAFLTLSGGGLLVAAHGALELLRGHVDKSAILETAAVSFIAVGGWISRQVAAYWLRREFSALWSSRPPTRPA